MLRMSVEFWEESSREAGVRSQVSGIRKGKNFRVLLFLTPELSKPTHWAVWWAENEPVSDGGNPPRPIRLFRMTEHSTQDLFASRVPVHSALVQKSVATITNSAGRLSLWMLGNCQEIRKRKTQNSWHEVCWHSHCQQVEKMNLRLRSISPVAERPCVSYPVLSYPGASYQGIALAIP